MTVWIYRGCHCCGGIEWGGEYPRECNDCDAWVSENDRTAWYPGGPFSGSEPGAFESAKIKLHAAIDRALRP